MCIFSSSSLILCVFRLLQPRPRSDYHRRCHGYHHHSHGDCPRVGRFKGVHLDPPARLVIKVGFGPPWWSLAGNNGATKSFSVVSASPLVCGCVCVERERKIERKKATSRLSIGEVVSSRTILG